jgi:hypothetical protein
MFICFEFSKAELSKMYKLFMTLTTIAAYKRNLLQIEEILT